MAKYHPAKEVSDAIEYALSLGWRFVRGSGHCYGTLRCQCADRTGVVFTPKELRLIAQGCPLMRATLGERTHGPSTLKGLRHWKNADDATLSG